MDSEESKQNSSLRKVTFEIDGAADELKVHAFASNTLFSDSDYMAKVFQYCHYHGSYREFKFNKAENQYMCNKKLNEELRYALERKYLKNFIGTTLERPGLLLKRKFVCDTYFNIPQPTGEQGFEIIASKVNNLDRMLNAQYSSIQKQFAKKKVIAPGGVSNIYLESRFANCQADNQLPSFLNFNDTPPLVIPNIVSRDGKYSFNFDSSLFTNITILAIDSTGATQKIIDVERDPKDLPRLKTRKTELDKPLDSESSYLETRNALCFSPKEKHIIEDITSVDYQAIDSLQKVGQVLQELLRLKHQENQALTTTQWLYNWNNLDTESKNKKYSMFMCNEFNFFLYFRDREYFDAVVKPSIA